MSALIEWKIAFQPSEENWTALFEAQEAYCKMLVNYRNGLFNRDLAFRRFCWKLELSFIFGGESPLLPGEPPLVFPAWPAFMRNCVQATLKKHGFQLRFQSRLSERNREYSLAT
jgi:hypothetical protein